MLTIMYRLTSYSAEQQPRHILDVPLHDIIHDIHARTVLRVIYNRNRKWYWHDKKGLGFCSVDDNNLYDELCEMSDDKSRL